MILACRNLEKGTNAVEKIQKETGNTNILMKQIDLESLESVRKFSEEIMETEERLDILVNNAGVAFLKDATTVDGLQLTMQINYFAPFLLTNLLLRK